MNGTTEKVIAWILEYPWMAENLRMTAEGEYGARDLSVIVCDLLAVPRSELASDYLDDQHVDSLATDRLAEELEAGGPWAWTAETDWAAVRTALLNG